ncbi:MAG: glutamate racemase [Mycobacteriales bacterium]
MIGIFDSGVGGASVLREIRRLLPDIDIEFVADSAYAPYGPRTPVWIQQRSAALTEFLIGRGAQAIVVACNTATAAAAATLRARYDVPIVAMEPAVKPAVAATRTGVVGVLATVGTLQSAKFAALLDRFGTDVTVVFEPGVGLVEQIEAGDLDGPHTRELVKERVAPMLEAGADVIVLGCTHYPFIRPLVQEVAGADVTVLDTGAAVASRLVRVLHAADVGTDGDGGTRYWTSGAPALTSRVLTRLTGQAVDASALP